MKKLTFMLLCAGSVTMLACNKTEKTETDTAVVTTETTTTDATADYEAMSRERATAAANQMARDLKLDADTTYQRKASEVYYTRATRRREIRRKYEVDTTGMAAELRIVDQETDRRFKEMLNPQQYSLYETNRTTYYGGFDESEMIEVDSNSDSAGSTSASAVGSQGSSGTRYPAGTTIKTKVEKDGDTKTKIEGPDGEVKIKTEDGETKIKRDPKD